MSAPELLPITMRSGGRVDVYSGVARKSGKIWASLVRPDRPTSTVVLFIHPTSNFLGHYALPGLAERGVAAAGLTTRYIANDSALLMENCVLDVAAAVEHLRGLGFERIVLAGNSGGGGLAALYQSQAERPTITATPAGDPPDLTQADLPQVDALLAMMAHPGRASVYTEWLDPAIRNEADPFDRDPELDLFAAGRTAPLDPGWVAAYRAAQVARNDRITAWVRDQLADLAGRSGAPDDLPFVVHGTCADPRFVDLSIEPSDRAAGTLWGPPEQANLMPATLGHLTSLRSWLSQWSVRDSNCDAVEHLRHVTVPVQVVYGSADGAAFPAHAQAMYDAIGHDRRALVEIKGADHYFNNRPDLLEEALDQVHAWLVDQDLVG
jgi:pimeloyl-ACP methyl ester carboxylesterase